MLQSTCARRYYQQNHFWGRKTVKTIRVEYLVVNSPNSYNTFIGPAFNLLGTIISTKFFIMKYPVDDEQVGIVRGDQKIAYKCYHNKHQTCP